MLTDDNIVQQNQGTGTTVSLPSATTSGNTIIVFASTLSYGALAATPITGFSQDVPSSASSPSVAILSKDTAGGETSWTIGL